MGSIRFLLVLSNKLNEVSGKLDTLCVFVCAFPQPGHIWIVSGRVVTYGICDSRWTQSWDTIRTPNDVAVCKVDCLLIRGITNAVTAMFVVLYLASLSEKQWAAFYHQGGVNSATGSCLGRHLSFPVCTTLDIVPTTHPGSPSLFSLPSSVSSSFPSSPYSTLSENLRLLRLSSMAIHISRNVLSHVRL